MARKKGAAVQTFSGAKMRKIRDRAKLTRREVSDRANVAESTIYQLETGGIKVPGLNLAAALAGALGVGIEELFE